MVSQFFCVSATAYYRLLTEIVLKEDFYDEQAERLKSCFSPGVIKIVDDKKKEGLFKKNWIELWLNILLF